MRSIIALVLLIAALQLQAQSVDEKVKLTDQYALTIKNRTDLEVKTLTNEEFMPYLTDGGGELNISYSGDSIVRIHEWIGLSYGIIETDFFFSREGLLFVSESERVFTYDEAQGEMNYSDPKEVYQGQFYFENAKIFKENRVGTRTFDEEMLYDSQSKEGVLIGASEQYLKLYGKP